MINISSFKTTKTTNPYNETDEVLELNINDGAVYRLNNVIKVSGTYTFSIWYKTNKNTTITLRILGNESQILSETSWKKFVKTITVNSVSDQNNDIDIEVASGAIGYFYEACLSEGVSDTSWTPAPEDIDDNIESVKSEFTQTAEEIKMSVKNIKGDVSNLNIQVGKIEQSVADNKGNISSLTTTIDGINATVKKQGESISSIDQKADKISQQVTSVKSELNSKIELTAGEISQKVDDVRADLSSEIKQTSDKISQTVTDMNKNLSTRIDQTAKDIELNASKTEEIGNSLNKLDIGGRNILKNSKNGIVCTGTDYSSTTTPGATITTKATGIGNAHRFIEGFYTTPVTELSKRVGTEFAFSLDVKITGSFTNLRTKVDFRDTSHNSSIFSNFIGINGLEVGKWTRVSGVASVKEVANVTATRSLFLFDWSNSTVGSTIEYRNLQLEEGNKSTDWTPAPEDIENELTNNYYNKTETDAKLKVQSDNITANVKKEVTTIKNDLDQNYYNKTETDSKFQIQSDSITSTVKKEVTTQIGNIDIGGRNLLLNTGFNTFNHWIKGSNTKSLQMVNGWCEVTIGGTWSGFVQEFIPEKNVEYIVSYEAYLVDTVAETAVLETDFGTPDQNQTINKTPAKYSLKLKYPSTSLNGKIDFMLSNNEVGKKWRIRNIKLEKGNKATDWSPAPEDMATADSLSDVNNNLTDVTNGLQSDINSTNKNLQDIQNSQNEVYEIVSQNKSQISSLTQRAEGFTMDFKTVNETVKQINNQFVTERDERYKYIKFIDGEIWLGKEVPIGEDDFKLVIKNDRISFLQNKVEVAYMSNNKLYVTDIHVTNSLQLGRFIFSARSNGNVGIRWINQ